MILLVGLFITSITSSSQFLVDMHLFDQMLIGHTIADVPSYGLILPNLRKTVSCNLVNI